MTPITNLPMKVTQRDQQILDLLLQGLPSRDIAQRLDIAQGTVKRHMMNLAQRANLDPSRHQAIGLVVAYLSGFDGREIVRS